MSVAAPAALGLRDRSATRATDLDIEMVDYRTSPRHWISRRSYALASEPDAGNDPDGSDGGGRCQLNPESMISQVADGDATYSFVSHHRLHHHMTLQGKIYNFLERPTGWKCFIYHFTV